MWGRDGVRAEAGRDQPPEAPACPGSGVVSGASAVGAEGRAAAVIQAGAAGGPEKDWAQGVVCKEIAPVSSRPFYFEPHPPLRADISVRAPKSGVLGARVLPMADFSLRVCTSETVTTPNSFSTSLPTLKEQLGRILKNELFLRKTGGMGKSLC